MEQPTDTNPGSPKRVRVDPDASNAALKTQSPLACAQESLQAYVTSLPPSTASILLRLARSHLHLRARLHNKKAQIEKMTNDATFLPHSARVSFKLSGSKQAEQETEFQTLQTETATLVDKFQRDLKTKIKKATEIEKKLLLAQLNDDLATALRVATKALLLTFDSTADADRILANILDNFSVTFLSFLESDKETFQALYKTRHSLFVFPNPYVAPINHVPIPPPDATATGTQNTGTQNSQPSQDDDDDEPTDSLVLHEYRQQLATQDPAPAPAPATRPVPGPLPFAFTITKIKRALEQTFIVPWETFLAQSKKNSTALALQKLATDHFDSAATETAAMEIDTEPPARRELIEELVQKAVDKRTSKLNSEVGRLRSQLAAKNSNRGQATGAAKTKSSAAKPKATRGRSQSRKRADEKPNATTADSKNKTRRTKSSNKQSPSKTKGSNNRRKQSSRTGTRS